MTRLLLEWLRFFNTNCISILCFYSFCFESTWSYKISRWKINVSVFELLEFMLKSSHLLLFWVMYLLTVLFTLLHICWKGTGNHLVCEKINNLVIPAMELPSLGSIPKYFIKIPDDYYVFFALGNTLFNSV